MLITLCASIISVICILICIFTYLSKKNIEDSSKIETDKPEIINSLYNALEMFSEIAELVSPKIKEKELEFTYNISSDLPKSLYGDCSKLKKIIISILDNAYKYTEKGFIHYEVKCINTDNICELNISVEDSGCGIKEEEINKVFSEIEKNPSEETEYTLNICKKLIELMGGKITIRTIYGQGSKFNINIKQTITDIDEPEIENNNSTLDLHDVKILLVDDAVLNLKVASRLLERYNANCITTVTSGLECLERIKNGEKYDLIFLDDMMPNMSGTETLKELKQIPNYKTPTIALTANAITGMREKYLAAGFDGYIAKPIDKEQLVKEVNQQLEKIYKEKSIQTEEKIEELEEEQSINNDIKPIETIPVVDINIPNISLTNDNYDEKYLENNGVDINHALELLGDMEMYNMTINDFVKEVEEKWNRIISNKDKNDMANYAIDVHSLKSDCKYLGFMKLADIAYQHELKSKENDSNFVTKKFTELEQEYKKVLEIAKTYVEHNKIEE